MNEERSYKQFKSITTVMFVVILSFLAVGVFAHNDHKVAGHNLKKMGGGYCPRNTHIEHRDFPGTPHNANRGGGMSYGSGRAFHPCPSEATAPSGGFFSVQIDETTRRGWCGTWDNEDLWQFCSTVAVDPTPCNSCSGELVNAGHLADNDSGSVCVTSCDGYETANAVETDFPWYADTLEHRTDTYDPGVCRAIEDFEGQGGYCACKPNHVPDGTTCVHEDDYVEPNPITDPNTVTEPVPPATSTQQVASQTVRYYNDNVGPGEGFC